MIFAPEPEPVGIDAVLYPSRVAGRAVCHLARPVTAWPGPRMTAICPDAAQVPVLEEIPADANRLVWCPACAAYADAAGLELPGRDAPESR